MKETVKTDLKDFALEPVPMDKRRDVYSTTTVWAGWVISVSAFLVGGTIAKGMALVPAIGAILTGNIILVFMATLIASIGCRLGLSTSFISRIIFGRKGSVIVSLVLGIIAMLFIGVLLGALGSVFAVAFPAVPAWLGPVLLALLTMLSGIYGFKGLAWLSNIAVPLLWILVALAIVRSAGAAGGLAQVFAIVPKGSLSFGAAASMALSTWIGGAILSPDIGRYAKTPSHILISATVAYILGAAVFEVASVIAGLSTATADLGVMMAKLGLAIPAVLIGLLAVWTTAQSNIYSASLAFTNFGDIAGLKVERQWWVVVATVIALLGHAFGLVTLFRQWLALLGATMGPIAGIYLAYFYLCGGFTKDTQSILKEIVELRVRSFVIWIIGFAFALLYTKGIPAFQSMILCALLYWVSSLVLPEKGKVEGKSEA